jgi:hypothetical protein
MAREAFSPGLRASSYIALVGQRLCAVSGPDIVRLWGKGTQLEARKSSSPTVRKPSPRIALLFREGHSKIRPLFIKLTLGASDCGLGCVDGKLRFARRRVEWRFPERRGVIGGACGILYSLPQRWESKQSWRFSSEFLWVHWLVVRDWGMEAIGSWLELLPEYLPRLAWSGSYMSWKHYRSQTFQHRSI